MLILRFYIFVSYYPESYEVNKLLAYKLNEIGQEGIGSFNFDPLAEANGKG